MSQQSSIKDNTGTSPFIKTRAQLKNKTQIGPLRSSSLQDKGGNLKYANKTSTEKVPTKNFAHQDPSPLLSKNYRNQEETLENSNNKSETNFSDLQLKYDALQKENESLKQQVKSADLKLDILGQTWLTDDTIDSYFQVLTVKVIGNKENRFLMNPTIVEAIKELEDISFLLDPLALHEKDILLIPINNAKYDSGEVDSYKSVNGSHWSLLVYEKVANKYYHYDSMRSSGNSEIAKLVSLKLIHYFQNSPTTDLISLDGPNQNNSFDCGVYLLHAVDYILLNFNSKNFFQNIKIPDFSENDCAKKRSYIAYVIKNGILTPKDIVLSFINHPSSNNDYDSIKTHIGKNDLSIKNPRNQTKPEILCEKAIQTEQASPTT
ncbi:SUMO1 sentrin specific peptidase 8, partial [Homalodisca vitripennis]